jgi:hypothetical protein
MSLMVMDDEVMAILLQPECAQMLGNVNTRLAVLKTRFVLHTTVAAPVAL